MILKKEQVLSCFLTSLLLVLVISNLYFTFFAKADILHSYSGSDTSPEGITLQDLSVEGSRELNQGDKITFFFILRNSPDNPSITLMSKGLFIAAIDPEGKNRSFGFMYLEETLEPGQSLIFYEEFFPNLAGTWKFWPSYEIITGEMETKIGPQDWHVFNPYIEAGDMPDLTPFSLSLTPSPPKIGEEVKITLITKNIGGTISRESNGALFIGDILWTSFSIPELDPGESTETTLLMFPPDKSTLKITLIVDYWESLRESNENNNEIEYDVEISLAEITPIEIVSGPRVVNITQNSAIVQWQTNEDSTSRINYGPKAGSYSITETENHLKSIHNIILTDLKPSTTYHYSVDSQGLDENTIRSRDKIFETKPLPDNIKPSLSLIDPDTYQGIVEVSAFARDNIGVEKTEFYLDDQLVFTDYSPPFELLLDTSVYENGIYTLKVIANDYSGQFIIETKPIDIINEVDKNAPKVEIIDPKEKDELSGKVQVTATLSDDVGLAYVFFKVNGQSEGFKGLPTNPKSKSVSFDWDTQTLENGQYRIGIETYDQDLRYGVDIIDVMINNPPILLPPKLKVIGHTLIRQDNHFYVSLTIKNIGDVEATDVIISDYLRSFQPISGSDTHADYKAQYTPSENMGDITIESKVDITPSWSWTYTYEAIPILFRGLIFQSDPNDSNTPSIGNPIKIWYSGQDGSKYYEEIKLPVLKTINGESLTTSYENAIKSADYLILTNAHRLFSHYKDKDVNILLSTMAKLARYEEGVLGYSSGDYGHTQVIRDLIKHGGEWSSKLKSGWSSNGYLLLVGETEIIPTWIMNLGTYETTDGPYTWNVLSDLPYANTYGDESKPELSIGRIIGNNAKELKVVIENSLNVLLKTPGYEFDRSDALLVSGFPDEKMGNFDGQVNSVSTIIGKTSSFTKIDTPDYAQYDSSGKIDDTLTKAAVEYIFFSATKGRDIIFLAGHGSWSNWDKIHKSDVLGQVDPFGWTNPFVFASSCKTGQYSIGYGLAESFLQRGAVVYLGATESGGWTPYSKNFFDTWDLDEPISLAVKQVKASLGNSVKDRIWSSVYHVYGDAKFGAINSLLKTVTYSNSRYVEAPSIIEVNIPDYEVNQINGEDHIEIPGGYDFFQIDKPLVPSYKITQSYPNGYQIQDVLLVQRSNSVNVSGLNIPNSTLTLPGSETRVLSTNLDGIGWWPEKDYEWTFIQNPENSTLEITLYPLSYNQQTSEAKFYDNYEFFVNYTTSKVEITGISTDKLEYNTGESVKIEIELNNSENGEQDVVINSIITDENTGEVLSSINLRTLKKFKGKASYSTNWNNTDLEPGNFKLIIELRDTKGVLLDQKIQKIRVGLALGEIQSFSVDSESFEIGDNIKINMIVVNSGNTYISGAAKINIFDSVGNLIDESNHHFTELTPYESLEIIYEWDTSEAQDSNYKILGYILCEGYSTTPVIENIYSSSIEVSNVEVSNLSIHPENAKIGEPIIIKVECNNTGTSSSSYTVILRIDGVVFEEETISLDPNGVTIVSFEVSADHEGTHTVDVNELVGNFTVEINKTGIPGFTYETALLGILLGVFLSWLRSRTSFAV